MLETLTKRPLHTLILTVADDEFILGYRNSEWTGIAPLLEEDVAFSSMAQDEIGHAHLLYMVAADMGVKTRREMLEEAVTVMREMWEGGLYSHHGKYYTVERARLYTLPDSPPPIIVASAGERATELAGRVGDGLFGLVPDSSLIEQFESAGGKGKPKFGQIHICWASSEDDAKETAHKWWPNAAVGGNLPWEVPLPSLFEDAAENVSPDDVAESVICGPDPEPLVEQVKEFADAGFTNVYFHQVGPDQEGFLRFAESELLPRLEDIRD